MSDIEKRLTKEATGVVDALTQKKISDYFDREIERLGRMGELGQPSLQFDSKKTDLILILNFCAKLDLISGQEKTKWWNELRGKTAANSWFPFDNW